MESVMKKLERSVSRGREGAVLASSGRGGAGNIRSLSRDGASLVSGPGQAPDDYSQSRGRELPAVKTGNQKIFTSGRGGAGNMRSPSRDAVIESRNALREEAKLVREHANALANGEIPVSHGRGGAGNISNSRSRSRSRDATAVNGSATFHSSGRGGFGNFKADESSTTLGRLAEEEDRKIVEERHEREHRNGQVHSTGRGGFANLFHLTNITDDHSTREKPLQRTPADFVSSGRGGAGNIVHT